MNKVFRNILIILLIIALLAAAFWYFFLYKSYLPAQLYDRYASFLDGSGRYERAAKFYAKATTLAPDDTDLALRTATAYENADNYTKSEYTLVRAISSNPEAIDLYLALSRLYIAQDKLLDAERLITACSNETVKAALTEMRPAAAMIQPEGGFTLEPTTFSLSYTEGTAYYSLTEEYPSTGDEAYSAPVDLDYGLTTVTAIVVGENGLVSPLATADFTVCGEIIEVEFEDEAFEEMVRKQLGKDRHAKILSTELWVINELTIPSEITALGDLRYFIGLKSLTLENSTATDFSVLAELPGLEMLNLNGSSLSSEAVDTISAVASLTELHVSDCDITTPDALAALTNLSILDISKNRISDLSALAAMTGLLELDLSENSLSTIAPLAAATQLEVLNLSGNAIGSIGALSANSALTTLKIAGCEISDLSPLENKAALTVLDASDNEITDVVPLQRCVSLVDLDLSSNQLEDLSPVVDLSFLKNLDASDNLLKTSPQFPEGCMLQTLNLSFNKLEEVDGLTALHEVNYICLNDNRLTDISAIADLANLLQVDAYHNPLVGVASLEARSILANYDPGYELPQEILDEMAAEEAAENAEEATESSEDTATEESLPSLDGQVEDANQ